MRRFTTIVWLIGAPLVLAFLYIDAKCVQYDFAHTLHLPLPLDIALLVGVVFSPLVLPVTLWIWILVQGGFLL
jgi:hypothetical protein